MHWRSGPHPHAGSPHSQAGSAQARRAAVVDASGSNTPCPVPHSPGAQSAQVKAVSVEPVSTRALRTWGGVPRESGTVKTPWSRAEPASG